MAQNRGELLYATHCSVCHAEQVHWRASKAVKDWSTLRAEVRKWQGVASLGWSEEDVIEVAGYLNDKFYRFPKPLVTAARTFPTGRGFWAATPSCRLDRRAAATGSKPWLSTADG